MTRKSTRKKAGPPALPRFDAAHAAESTRLSGEDPFEFLSLQLRLIIKARGLKLATLERLAKCRVNRWYRGLARLSPRNLLKVCDALDLTLIALDPSSIPEILPLPAERALKEES